MLISLSGVPGTGKTTIARELAQRINAFHLSIDSIERVVSMSLAGGQSSYRVAYQIAYARLRDVVAAATPAAQETAVKVRPGVDQLDSACT